jgi:hypothetical protein
MSLGEQLKGFEWFLVFLEKEELYSFVQMSNAESDGLMENFWSGILRKMHYG